MYMYGTLMYGGHVIQHTKKLEKNHQLVVDKHINFAAVHVCAKAALHSMYSY